MAAGDTMPGRVVAGPNDLEQPGDHTMPMKGYTGPFPAVFFIKPNGSPGHVTSPPHTFTIEDDGTLTVAASISNLRANQTSGPGDGWHGYLERGQWREV